ncbi:MAG: protein-L-isoaspartate(D-aspartate) O-methyltransferase [Burkholderiales bacterium]
MAALTSNLTRYCWLIGLAIASTAQGQSDYAKARDQMVLEIERMAAMTALETGRPGVDPLVLATMNKVERHRFVPGSQQRHAYENRPLPIGHGQTISQPYIVALMTDLLDPQSNHSVLEIGTGSGYQAAVLAELARRVYTIEIIEPLGRDAGKRLARLGYRNVEVRIADGYYGWPEHGPFDGIVVTAAATHVPPPLIRQLKPGGKMVIPVGASFLTQYLLLVEKHLGGAVTSRQILPVRFVPLTGKR